jgi:hypothetical protein
MRASHFEAARTSPSVHSKPLGTTPQPERTSDTTWAAGRNRRRSDDRADDPESNQRDGNQMVGENPAQVLENDAPCAPAV